jgi:hypothetical protein
MLPPPITLFMMNNKPKTEVIPPPPSQKDNPLKLRPTIRHVSEDNERPKNEKRRGRRR